MNGGLNRQLFDPHFDHCLETLKGKTSTRRLEMI